MRIAVINPNTSEPVTSHILAAAREVASTPASMVAFTATRGPAAIESHVDEAYAAAEVARIVTANLGSGTYAFPEPLAYAEMIAPSQMLRKHRAAEAL